MIINLHHKVSRDINRAGWRIVDAHTRHIMNGAKVTSVTMQRLDGLNVEGAGEDTDAAIRAVEDRIRTGMMTTDWKQDFANEAEQAVLHDMTDRVIGELLDNLQTDRNGLPYYGILKVCNIVAQVARAQALGIDPETLRMTSEESVAALQNRLQVFVDAGLPVVGVVVDSD